MENPRKYGKPPFKVAVIHGGPGALGEMASVAKELSSLCGVLEPLQTKSTIKGQIEEFKSLLENSGVHSLTLVGFSWGAWLSFIFAATYPSFVNKLILISSGPFEEKYAKNIMRVRLSRMNEQDKKEMMFLTKSLESQDAQKKNQAMARFGELMLKADSFAILPHSEEMIECQYDIYQEVWQEAEELRSNGELLKFGRKIECPIVAIHGDYDSHPYNGVKEPLGKVLKDFKFVLLEKCGHCPWLERYAKDKFYTILRKELTG